MKNFDITQFTGDWFVRRKTGTHSTCLKNRYFFTKGEWRVVESRDWYPLDAVGIQSNLEHEGYLSVPDVAPARMRVKFRMNVAGKGDYTIVDTDYKNYAVVYECQNLVNIFGLAISRRSGAILTRSLDWNDAEIIAKGKAELKDLGVETDEVSHAGCEKPNFQVSFDKDLVENVGNAFGEAVDATRDLVEKGLRTGLEFIGDSSSTTPASNTPAKSNAIPIEPFSETIDLRGQEGNGGKREKIVRPNEP
jgi:hypothetical protein